MSFKTLADIIAKLREFQKEVGDSPETISLTLDELEQLKAIFVEQDFIRPNDDAISITHVLGMRVKLIGVTDESDSRS